MTGHHLSIEKIGGTSMSRFSEIVDNIILKNNDHIYGRIYVVSAYAGVTNDLLEHKKTNQPGIYKLFEDQQNYPIKMIRLQESLYKLNETFSHPGKLNWWHKSFGTMNNLAERSPEFKPVFQAAQGFIDDTSYYATEAADLAPRILPRLEN